MSYFKSIEDKIVTCPFNVAHQVPSARLQYHIVKCMKNYPDYMVCPYNACHRIVKAEYNNHIATCPNKNLLNSEIEEMSYRSQGAMHDVDQSFNLEYEDWTKE